LSFIIGDKLKQKEKEIL